MKFYETTRQKISNNLVSLVLNSQSSGQALPQLLPKVAELLLPSQQLKFGDYTLHLPQLAALFSWPVPQLLEQLEKNYKPSLGLAETWSFVPPHLNFRIDDLSLRTAAFTELSENCLRSHPEIKMQAPIYHQFKSLLDSLGSSPDSAANMAKSLPQSLLPTLFQDTSELNLIRALSRHDSGKAPSFLEETAVQFYQSNMILHKDPNITKSRIALMGMTLMMS